jgi:ABC-type glycerol-3-phosphate transport system substrate-binding protein
MRTVRLIIALLVLAFASAATAQVKLTMWTHWAAEKIKREFVEDAIKRFEAANPNVKIEVTWY